MPPEVFIAFIAEERRRVTGEQQAPAATAAPAMNVPLLGHLAAAHITHVEHAAGMTEPSPTSLPSI